MIFGKAGEGHKRLDADKGGTSGQLIGKLIFNDGFDEARGLLPFSKTWKRTRWRMNPSDRNPFDYFHLLDPILAIYLGEYLLLGGHPWHPCMRKC